MIQIRSRLDVADNSGARMATMIGVVGKGTAQVAQIGDVITANVKEASATGTVKRTSTRVFARSTPSAARPRIARTP